MTKKNFDCSNKDAEKKNNCCSKNKSTEQNANFSDRENNEIIKNSSSQNLDPIQKHNCCCSKDGNSAEKTPCSCSKKTSSEDCCHGKNGSTSPVLSSCCTGGHTHKSGKDDCACGVKHESNDFQRDLVILIISAVALVLGYFKVGKTGWWDFSYVAIAICGLPIIVNALNSLLKNKRITAGLLVSVALIASCIIGEFFAAGEVAFIMQLGGFLESITVAKANKGIKSLISLTPDYALLKDGTQMTRVKTSTLKVGDVIVVKTGENIAVDGVIVSGTTSINQSAITGESLPVDKTDGDEVFEGTTNIGGVIEVQATKTGENSSIRKMARMVIEANNIKAPIVKIADKLASYLVPAAIAASIIVGIIVSIFLGISEGLNRAVTIMVVFCPCSLVLATPAAVMAGIARASKLGIIIKSGTAIERMADVKTIAFDKTGTITSGKLEVCNVITDMDLKEFIAIAASAERLSEHPISAAVAEYALKMGVTANEVSDYKTELGRGLTCKINGQIVAIGNAALMQSQGIEVAYIDEVKGLEEAGKRALYVAIDNRICGIIGISDAVKSTSAEAISDLKSVYGLKTVMLTGDGFAAGNEIGSIVGVDEIKSDCLPEDKVNYIKNAVDSGEVVAMVGDGVNDAPALATASVGIAMGAMGSDIAVETADIAIMTDDLAALPKLVRHSKKTLRTIKGNITFSMSLNVVAILLASFGVINPVIGALIHNCGSVLVVLNSVRLLYSK